MKTLDEIMKIIAEKLEEPLQDLWDALTPEERREAFSKRIIEYVESTF